MNLEKHDKLRMTLTGLNLRQALAVADALGCDISQPHASGEFFIRKDGGRPVEINSRKKSASRALTVFLRKISKDNVTIEMS